MKAILSHTYIKLDPDASAARYPSQTSTIPYHTYHTIFNTCAFERVWCGADESYWETDVPATSAAF